MFSWKRINEKVNKEKHWKKQLSVNKIKNVPTPNAELQTLTTSKDVLLLSTKPSPDFKGNADKAPSNKEAKWGLSWRFFNNLDTENEKQISSTSTFGIEGNSSTRPIEKTKNDALKLHKTISAIQKKDHCTKKRKLIKNKLKSISKTKKKVKSRKDSNVPNFDAEMAEFLKVLNEDTPTEELKLNSSQLLDKSSKYVNLLGKKDEETSLFSKENKLYLSSRLDPEKGLLVALFPDTKIYISGNYKLKLIVGSISICGFKFHEGEEQIVFSPACYSTLSITVLEGVQIKEFKTEKLKKLKIPTNWIQEFNISQEQMVTIVKLTSYNNNATRILEKTEMVKEYNPDTFDLDLWKEVVGVRLIENFSKTKLRPFIELDEWNGFIDALNPKIAQQEKLCLVVAGGKNVGKSSLMKFIVNNLLCNDNVNQVACLDLDPGQCEFSLPASLSLSIIKSPLLGPPFSHREIVDFSFQKTILIGELNMLHVVKEYLDIVQSLMREFRKINPSLPLVVNTMGFVRSTGYDILVDILKITQPSHLISIESDQYDNNFLLSLDCDFVSDIKRGILRSHYSQLDYELVIFKSVSSVTGNNSKLLRSINIMAYLSQLWDVNNMNMISETLKPCVQVDWTSIAIHVQGSFVPHCHILQAINGSLVALCRVNEEYIEEVGQKVPLKIKDGSNWTQSNTCLGWGVVKGIDPTTSEIHILTPLDQDMMVVELNAIVLCKTLLPDKFQQFFTKEGAPYLQLMTGRM